MKVNAMILGGVLLAACSNEPVNSVVLGQEENALDECTSPPIIDHDEFSDNQPSNADVQVIAYVYADEGCEVDIMSVELYYRQETATDWSKVNMTPGQEADEWRGRINAQSLGSAGIYYYISAIDKAGQAQIEPQGADTDLLDAYFFGLLTN